MSRSPEQSIRYGLWGMKRVYNGIPIGVCWYNMLGIESVCGGSDMNGIRDSMNCVLPTNGVQDVGEMVDSGEEVEAEVVDEGEEGDVAGEEDEDEAVVVVEGEVAGQTDLFVGILITEEAEGEGIIAGDMSIIDITGIVRDHQDHQWRWDIMVMLRRQ